MLLVLTFSLLSLLAEVGGARVLYEECCIGRSSAFLLGAGSILSGSSDEWNQSSTALVEKEVLPCRDVVFTNCTCRYPVVGRRTVGFDFLVIFSFADDDCSCIVANVDNVVQVIVRVVERVAELLLMFCLENHLRVVV